MFTVSHVHEIESGVAGRGRGGCVAFTWLHVMFENEDVWCYFSLLIQEHHNLINMSVEVAEVIQPLLNLILVVDKGLLETERKTLLCCFQPVLLQTFQLERKTSTFSIRVSHKHFESHFLSL